MSSVLDGRVHTIKPKYKGEASHKGLPVQGYRPQSESAVARVNANKQDEETLLRQLDLMTGNPEFDQRWVAIARSHFEQGYMALNRAIFRPARVQLPEDDDGA